MSVVQARGESVRGSVPHEDILSPEVQRNDFDSNIRNNKPARGIESSASKPRPTSKSPGGHRHFVFTRTDLAFTASSFIAWQVARDR